MQPSKHGLVSGNSGVLVPHVSSSAFISDFKWHRIKSIQLTLIQSLGKPPLLSQEHKPVTCINPSMKAGNVQNSARIRFAHGPGRMNSPTEKEVFFISSQPGKSFPQHCKYLISGTLSRPTGARAMVCVRVLGKQSVPVLCNNQLEQLPLLEPSFLECPNLRNFPFK